MHTCSTVAVMYFCLLFTFKVKLIVVHVRKHVQICATYEYFMMCFIEDRNGLRGLNFTVAILGSKVPVFDWIW